MLEETEVTRGPVGRYVKTYAYADGRLDVRWKGHCLPYTVFDKEQRVTHAAITENKRLGDVLAYIKERQETLDKPTVKTNSDKNGYVKREHGPGRRKDFVNDPAVIAKGEGPVAAAACEVKDGSDRLKAKAEAPCPTRPDLILQADLPIRSALTGMPFGNRSEISTLQTDGHVKITATFYKTGPAKPV